MKTILAFLILFAFYCPSLFAHEKEIPKTTCDRLKIEHAWILIRSITPCYQSFLYIDATKSGEYEPACTKQIDCYNCTLNCKPEKQQCLNCDLIREQKTHLKWEYKEKDNKEE
jgi:hypothetical protein